MSGAAPVPGADAGGYTAFLQLSAEISRAQDAGALIAALAMVYVGIDTMTLLACPVGQAEQGKKDFLAWVDTYLRADPASDYQYEGPDVYAARCAVLHSYGSIARDHSSAKPPRTFGYADNGPHLKDEAARVVIISIATLIHDFFGALETFMQAMLADAELKRRVDSRVYKLLLSREIQHNDA